MPVNDLGNSLLPIRTCAILLTVLLTLLVYPAWAMENYSEVLRDQYGRAMGGATVIVYQVGTGDVAPIYSDNGTTLKSNPFLTDALDGQFNFYAANGVYDIVYLFPGATFDPERTRRISLFDVNDFTASGGSSQAPIPSGDTFPSPASTNYQFFLTSDSATGDCNELSGSALTLCRYNGTEWVAVSSSGSDALDAVTSRGNTTTGNDEANPFEILGSGGQVGRGWSADRTTAGESRFRCKEAAGVNKCNYYRQLDAGFKGGFKHSSGAVGFEYDNDTNKITIATIDCTLAGVSCTFSDERHFRVATVQAGVASANFDLPSTNAPVPTADVGTNTIKAALAFDDTTDQSFQDSWILPSGFNSVDVSFRWKAAATSGAVNWCAQLIRVNDGTTSDPAFPAQSASTCISDTAKGTTLQENVATITGVLCAGCGPGDQVYVRVSRDGDGSGGTDTMVGNALLLTYGRTFRVIQ